MKRAHEMPFGASMGEDGGVRFALWAPGVEQVRLELVGAPDGDRRAADESLPMMRSADGWHVLPVGDARAGDRYRFRLPDGLAVPDPASRFNPGDVHAASEVVDPRAYEWHDAAWRGRPWAEAVIYELHVGSFTAEGSFAAAIAPLRGLAELGVTAIELMPLADFPGRRNWGYDGVLPFGPDAAYGTPGELKALVDAAHGLGLMVFVDVVYNHFGPDGNYLYAYCPEFFNPAHRTPWGAAINYDAARSRTVRDFFVHNALYWIEEFHADGLRMDAIQTIFDDSPRHIVREICAALREGPGRERQVHIVVENEANGASYLERDCAGAPREATAQWNDDFHHAAHVLLTGESDGYYADYAREPLAALGRALAEGFVYQGQASAYRGGAARGEPSTALPPVAFVSSLQTHDQVGNRAFGERIAMLADPALLDTAYACLLLAPHIPMLFMGEEFAASTPFSYFCDFSGELAAAVTHGRREEFGRFAGFADAAARQRIPDPNAASTFEASRLRWRECSGPPHAERRAKIAELLALRRKHLVAHLHGAIHGGAHRVQGRLLHVDWELGDGVRWHLVANFGADAAGLEAMPGGEIVHCRGLEGEAALGHRVAPGGVCVTLERAPLA